MTLPACNPIDYGWFSKGAAIDHVGTQNHLCKVCDGSTLHEKFVILVGSPVGFGAPFFAKPFMKHSSTKGKIGGTRGHVVQCRQCNSLWAFDQEGVQALAKAGLPSELIALDRANEYRNRLAKEVEDNEVDPVTPVRPSSPSSRIEKTRE
jgi:hypothetical protein